MILSRRRMAESSKLRLVRCPKCQNLLPELEDYSVYQCGGCGAVLRGKLKNKEADSSSKKLEEESAESSPSKSRNVDVGKGAAAGTSDTPESNVLSNADSSRGQDGQLVGKRDDFADRSANPSRDNLGKWIVEDGPGMDMEVNEKDRDSILQPRSQKSAQITGHSEEETTEPHGFRNKISRTGLGGIGLSTSGHQEGCSRDKNPASCDYQKPLRNLNERDGPRIVPNLAEDRAELLRKLDELREQLTRSCDVADKTGEKAFQDGARVLPSDAYGAVDPRGSSIPSVGLDKAFHKGNNNHGRTYCHNYLEPFSCNGPMSGLYPAAHNSLHFSAIGDPVDLQIQRRTTSQQLPGQCLHHSHPYYSGQCVDASHDLFEPYPHNPMFHQPACPCFHCRDQHRRIPPRIPHKGFSAQRCPDMPYNPGLYFDEDIRAFGPIARRPRTVVPPPASYGHVYRAPKVVLSSLASRRRPVSGGSPFLTCHNCFELLQLPKKMLLVSKRQQRLRCGACSTVIDFSIINNKLVFSFNGEETKQNISGVEGSSHKGVRNGGNSHSHGHLDGVNGDFSSDDYDNSGYEFHSLDTDPIEPTRQGFNSSKPHEMQSFLSSSASASEDEKSSDSLKPPHAGSPLQEHFDYSSNHAIDRFGMGNRSARSEKEKVVSNKVAIRQNSLKEAAAAAATEMEVCFNEDSNAEVSNDSGVNREVDRPRAKRTESFLANIIKKGFKDLARSGQNDDPGKSNVSINGQPISQRLVKKAEKLAGPIQPGNYWYDHRAGFWGVMDGPCLGIIPPFIEELNYPMPDNCANGITGVFVNGRELHQKDLDLLTSRGLPTERDRSYIIDISGRVVDEDTGEELDALGKLAPTVEKLKRGFGMKPPRPAA